MHFISDVWRCHVSGATSGKKRLVRSLFDFNRMLFSVPSLPTSLLFPQMMREINKLHFIIQYCVFSSFSSFGLVVVALPQISLCKKGLGWGWSSGH